MATTQRANVDPPRERFVDLARVPVRFALGSFAAEILGWGFIGSKPWRNWLHAHTYYEICYAFRGRGVFRMLGTEQPVSAGQVFIAKPGEEHEIISSRRDPLGIYFWSFTLVPIGQKASDSMVDRLLRGLIDSHLWVSARAPGMLRTLELMTEEAVRAEAGCAQAVEGLARKLLLDTARAAIGDPLPAESAGIARTTESEAVVARARRFILDNLARGLSVRDIAAEVGLSERHFSRVFRQATGDSPLEYLVQSRVDSAAQLLLDPSLAIKDIAKRVGFPDVRYFTTVFRRATG
nr:helix-turn-helix transcriptional regulator [Planctomycetota bacterium]